MSTSNPGKLYVQKFLLWMRHVRKRADYVARPKVWILSAILGVVVGYGMVGFARGIHFLTEVFYGVGPQTLASGARGLDPARSWIAPVIGGLLVGALLYLGKRMKWLPEAKCQGVAEVIEARAGPPGHISFRGGMTNTVVAAVALGSGASAGREGPAVLFSGTMATVMSEKFKVSGTDARTLIGCAAAAAVAASFNAPIAGVLFALEVVLGNYALSIFGPVALASAIGAMISRFHLGDAHAFAIPEYGDPKAYEVPLAALLGIVCGAVSFAFLQLNAAARVSMRRFLVRYKKVEPAMLPVIAGAIVGTIAIFFPEILGVGYETTSKAISGEYALPVLTILLILKIFATVVCLTCRFGSGVFSGGLFLGAISGAAFGATLGLIMPGASADPAFYAMIGMGAVSGAIIGAPISTTLIVFELTGDYEMTIALMVAVGIATLISQLSFGSSWFHWQLNQRGYDLSEGPQGVILQTIRVRDVMRPMTDDSQPLDAEKPRLRANQTLGEALARMSDLNLDGMPVVSTEDKSKIIGYVTQIKALNVYNRALVDSHIEHHR